MTKLKKAINFLFTYKFLLLLISLMATIVIPVYFENRMVNHVISYFFISLTLVISMLIFTRHKQLLFIRMFALLVFTAITLNWIDFWGGGTLFISIPRLIFVGGFYLAILMGIFNEFRRRDEVNLDFIFGAISAYLILGMLAAFISVLINIIYPGSFSFPLSPVDFQDHIYFNFVTLTTLGYGDILPVTPQGQMHAVVVALVGQLYLTITIALIVGRYLANSTSRK